MAVQQHVHHVRIVRGADARLQLFAQARVARMPVQIAQPRRIGAHDLVRVALEQRRHRGIDAGAEHDERQQEGDGHRQRQPRGGGAQQAHHPSSR